MTAVSGASGLGGLFSSFSFLRSFFSNKSRRVCVYHVVGVGRTVQMYSLWPFCIQGLALGNPCPGGPTVQSPYWRDLTDSSLKKINCPPRYLVRIRNLSFENDNC